MHKFEVQFDYNDPELWKRFKDVYLHSTYDGHYVDAYICFRMKFINNIWDEETISASVNAVKYEIEVEDPEDEIIFRLKYGV